MPWHYISVVIHSLILIKFPLIFNILQNWGIKTCLLPSSYTPAAVSYTLIYRIVIMAGHLSVYKNNLKVLGACIYLSAFFFLQKIQIKINILEYKFNLYFNNFNLGKNPISLLS